MINKEYGSDFHLMPELQAEDQQHANYGKFPHSFYHSGRAALYAILAYGIKEYGWQLVALPSYYCHEVTAFVRELPIQVRYYENTPLHGIDNGEITQLDIPGNVIVNVNFFGIKKADIAVSNAVLIDDLTHDFEYTKTDAHYCFASLRKILPVPAGGVLWSPRSLALPLEKAETMEASHATLMKFSAMALKRDYLAGYMVKKESFRQLFMNSEAVFSDIKSYGRLSSWVIDQITRLPVSGIYAQKEKNYGEITRNLRLNEAVSLLETSAGSHPLGVLLYFKDAALRDKARAYLVKKSIYPAVLWPHQTTAKNIDFAGRILFVHCDIRYSLYDIEYIYNTINDAFDEN